jgi:hexokinase
VERAASITKWHGSRDGVMVINMEWGGFGSGTRFPMLPFHDVDHQLDALSPNEGKQRYEKMMSGMYLGEITRLLLVQLVSAGALFASGKPPLPPAATKAIATPWQFSTALMSDIAQDVSPDLGLVGRILADNLSITSTNFEDRRTVQEV